MDNEAIDRLRAMIAVCHPDNFTEPLNKQSDLITVVAQVMKSTVMLAEKIEELEKAVYRLEYPLI